MNKTGKKKIQKIKNTNAVLVTEENDDIDVLDRKPFVDQIKQIIEYYADKKQSVSFSIQGLWGSGKSWIINKVYNELYDIQDFNNCGGKYCIFTYNAWDYDYYDEPLLSLFISIYKQLNNENAIFIKNEETRKKVKALFETLKDSFLEELKPIPFIGNIINFKQNYDEKLEGYDNKIRKYDYHFDINQIMEAVLKGFNKLTKDKTVVLFIDELDRCLPEYAIKVLERIHHIKQYVKNIVIVYSMDKAQLEKTIKNCFGGSNPNSTKNYLAKFIEFGLTIPPSHFNIEIAEKYKELFQQFDFVNCDAETEVVKLVSSLLPESIPIRIHQLILKKIIFINNQLNQSSERFDYSILITELFIAIAEEVNMKWSEACFKFNQNRHALVLETKQAVMRYQHPKEVEDFILRIACTDIYKYEPSRNGENKFWLDIYEVDPVINSLVLYYIARLIKDNQFYSYRQLKYLQKNDEFLQKFLDYYRILQM